MACNMNGFQGIFNVLPTSLDSQKQLCEMGNTGITTPILKMVKLRLREVTCFIQGQDQSTPGLSLSPASCFPPGDLEGYWEQPNSYHLSVQPCTNLWTIVSLNAEDLWLETKNSPISAKYLYRNIFLSLFLLLIEMLKYLQ